MNIEAVQRELAVVDMLAREEKLFPPDWADLEVAAIRDIRIDGTTYDGEYGHGERGDEDCACFYGTLSGLSYDRAILLVDRVGKILYGDTFNAKVDITSIEDTIHEIWPVYDAGEYFYTSNAQVVLDQLIDLLKPYMIGKEGAA